MPYAFDDFRPLLRKLKTAADPLYAERRYLCALVAALAYRHVPSAEIDDARRALVIPCAEFRRIVATGMPATISAEELAAALDGAVVFAVEERGVVAVGLLVEEMLFIGFRGTRYLYDWKVNLRATMDDGFGGRIHRGFLEETLRVIPPLVRKIAAVARDGDGPPDFESVYVSGHSLGGAVAAIATRFMPLAVDFLCTFGAPRYGDAWSQFETWVRMGRGVSSQMENVQGDGDAVPSVPPRWMGYADNGHDVTTAGRRVGLRRHSSTWLYAAGQVGRFFASLAAPHSMERYRKETGSYVEAPNSAQPLIRGI